MLPYDEGLLVRDLLRLDTRSRVAFAASCAERLFRAYEDFFQLNGRGDTATLGTILAKIWAALGSGRVSAESVQEDVDRCMALVPGEEDEPWGDEHAYADDAVSAIAYALRTLKTGDAQEAAWAARRAYEAADHYVLHRVGVEEDDQVLAHPIVQAEVVRQRRDLEDLLGECKEKSALFAHLRDRAKEEARLFFAESRD